MEEGCLVLGPGSAELPAEAAPLAFRLQLSISFCLCSLMLNSQRKATASPLQERPRGCHSHLTLEA